MAINYTPIGFNTKTYSNPTTMNHMDNGIKSACDGVDSLSTGKVDKVSGKGLSTEDYTTAEKTKLAGISTGATKTTIKNDLTTTTAGSALDASQGKVLADLISTVTADTSVHTASGTSLSLSTGKGGMRWQDEAIGGMTHKSPNMIQPTLKTATTSNGVTCTPNGDGTFTVIGTAKDGNAVFNLTGTAYQDPAKLGIVKGTTYKLVGCPTGGSGNTYKLRLDSTSALQFNDFGSGSAVNIATSSTDNFRIDIVIYQGQTVNLTFKPMLTTDTSLTYADYEPYGIHSAGDMYGCVDGGTLDWMYADGTKVFYADYAQLGIGNKGIIMAYCEKYNSVLPVTGTQGMTKDGTISTSATTGRFFIKDMRYSSAVEFKAAMNGTYIAYIPADNATPSQYALVVEEVGKNRFDVDNIQSEAYGKVTKISENEFYVEGQYYASFNVELEVDVPYIVSGEVVEATKAQSVRFQYEDGTLSTQLSMPNVKFTPTKKVVSIYIYASGGRTRYRNFQIEEGNAATDYVPFSSKTYPIPIPHPARGIGDVREIVRKVGQQWVEDTKYGVVDLATRNWTYLSASNVYYCDSPSDTVAVSAMGAWNLLCDRYERANGDFAEMADMTIELNTNSFSANKKIVVKDSSLGASGKPSGMLIYELATHTTEPLPSQSAMYEMESYAEQTHITTADSLAEMNVEYGQSDLMATALNGERLAQKAIAE